MDRNETIDALKHCAGTGMDACRGCPNVDADWAAAGYVGCREFSEDNATVPVALIRRTIELLQLQAPRVMTFKELHEIPERTVVWLEGKDIREVEPFIYAGNGWYSPYFSSGVKPLYDMLATEDEYGAECRVWTGCPSDEQRKYVRWDTIQ